MLFNRMLPLAVTICVALVSDIQDARASAATQTPDWVQVLKLTLANFALSHASTEPDGFKCATKGSDHDNCKCWSKHGDPLDGEVCHEPKNCLMYSDDETGYFNFTQVPNTTKALQQTLALWGVPSEMNQAFSAAALVQSATFATFHFDVKPEPKKNKAHFDAHVGTLRNWQGSYYVGYVAGSADGDMVQPLERHNIVGNTFDPSVVVCAFFKMVKRGYRTDEIKDINSGLQSYAYRKAAAMAKN